MGILKKIRKIGSSSSSSSSSKKQMAGAKKIRGTNNLPAILFHSFHGENVRVSPNGQNARRVDSFCRGIAFSNRPVKVTEKIYIKFTDISSNWSGALRFGFTSHDPASYAKNGGLPKYVCPDLTNRPGHWAKALGERLAQTDSILCYYVTSDGSVHYSINGEDKGVFFSGVQTSSNQLWALIDIYGNTTGIEFVDPRAQISNQRNQRTEALSITSSDPQPNCSQLEEETYVPLPPVFPLRTLPKDHEASLYSSSPSSCTSSSSTPGLTPLCFHKTRGCNIRLSNDRCVAERNDSHYSQGYTFTQRPLRLNEKFIIQIQKKDESYTGSLAFGLSTCDPSTLNPNDLPEDPHQFLDRPEYWVVVKDVASGLRAGEVVAFIITESGKVQLLRDRQAPVTLMHVDASQKFYAFFDLYGSTVKIKVLGTTLETSSSQSSRVTQPLPRPEAIYCSVNRSIAPRPVVMSAGESIYVPLKVNVNLHNTNLGIKKMISPPPQVMYETLSKYHKGHPQPHHSPSSYNSIYSQVSGGNSSRSLSSISNECTVCYEKQINAVLYTCGHMCMCYDCALKQWKSSAGGHCPICRAAIRDVIRTYWS